VRQMANFDYPGALQTLRALQGQPPKNWHDAESRRDRSEFLWDWRAGRARWSGRRHPDCGPRSKYCLYMRWIGA